ncbi:MAG: hypothetical protein C0618_03485 [Desulfuromonas sp.]|nr:MAG: hypothetical protein C0618_03485 [Desulfuromonas sp.]
MKYLTLTLLLVACFAVPYCVADDCGTEPLSFADALTAEGDHYRAITEYKRFLHRCPTHADAPRARLAIAQSLIAGKRWDEADRALETIFSLDADNPSSVQARTVYADSAFARSDYPLARQRYLSLLESKPSVATVAHARYRIGWTWLEEDAVDAAWEHFSLLDSERAAGLSDALQDYRVLPRKSPVLAGTLSALLPGAGQLYTGRARQAILAFVLNAAFLYGAVEAFENDNHVVGGILLFFEGGWYTGNIYNAANNAHKFNRRQQAAQKLKMRQQFGLRFDPHTGTPLLLAQLTF